MNNEIYTCVATLLMPSNFPWLGAKIKTISINLLNLNYMNFLDENNHTNDHTYQKRWPDITWKGYSKYEVPQKRWLESIAFWKYTLK